MRRSLNLACQGETLIGTIDEGDRRTGLLIVTGGRQTRIGPHRMMAELARDLARAGYPVFRFDRRGIGDSSGSDPGFRASAPDILAAANIFREAAPQLDRLWGLGLCDGASALALHHPGVDLDGLILLNPWVVEAEAGAPPPAAIRAHYIDRLSTLDGWRKLLTTGFSPSALIRGLRSVMRKSDQGLADDVMQSLAGFRGKVSILLAERDATARAFLDQYRGRAGRVLRMAPNISLAIRDSASHSFAGVENQSWLTAQILAALSESR